jgi:hypothetical protein
MDAGPTTPAADSPVTASRRRILARTRLDFWLDALLLVAYTLAYSLGFTRIATHEWLGIGLGVVLLVHLTLQRHPAAAPPDAAHRRRGVERRRQGHGRPHGAALVLGHCHQGRAGALCR